MAANFPLPPPGFDDLGTDDQIKYVQSLWDRIAAKPGQVPVPDWHRQLIQQRLADHPANATAARPWDEVRNEIETNLKSRSQNR